MKFIKDKSAMITATTICAVLILFAVLGLYYLQNDIEAVPYFNIFGYGILFVSAVFALLHVINKEGRNDLAIGVAIFALLKMAHHILSIVKKLPEGTSKYVIMIEPVAIAALGAVALCFVVKNAIGCKLFESAFAKLILFVVFTVPTVLFKTCTDLLMYDKYETLVDVVNVILALVLIAGVIFAIINIIKKKETFINWTYIFSFGAYAFIYGQKAILYIQKLFNVQWLKGENWTKTAEGLALMVFAILMIALVNETIQIVEIKKKIKR